MSTERPPKRNFEKRRPVRQAISDTVSTTPHYMTAQRGGPCGKDCYGGIFPGDIIFISVGVAMHADGQCRH